MSLSLGLSDVFSRSHYTFWQENTKACLHSDILTVKCLTNGIPTVIKFPTLGTIYLIISKSL